MFKTISFALLAAICTGCANLPLIESAWQPATSGTAQSADSTEHLHGSQNVLYSLSNDQVNLYVKLMVADRKTQMQIIRNGLTLWLDTTGHKKQKLGINYPLPARENRGQTDFRQQLQINTAGGSQASQTEFKRRMVMNMIEMDLIGFNGAVPTRVPAINSTGPTVSLQVDSLGVLQYKATIPFASLHYHPALQTGKKMPMLSLGLTTGKQEEPTHREGGGGSERGGGIRGGGGGGMGGGMGGGGGMQPGGMPGGGMHGGGGGYGATPEDPLDIWMHVQPANVIM